MQFRRLQRRFQRRIDDSQRQVGEFGKQTERQIERLVFKRFNRLVAVRKFVIIWCLLLIGMISGVLVQIYTLSGFYQTIQPVPGGIYSEGVLGTFTTANPLYATSDIDSTVSHLIFNGLFKYNRHNQLVGDLASRYTVNSQGTSYTVYLKPHITWQDGQPLTSKDVVFTYHLIQDPDVQSPLLSSWQGIKISAPTSSTIVFTLPDVLASFPDTMINGIVPQHLLANVAPASLRSADFNTAQPIGSGPFKWQAINVNGSDPNNAQEQIVLLPFSNYLGGKPKLQAFFVHSYADRNQLEAAFRTGQLSAIEGLTKEPSTLRKNRNVKVHSLLFTAANFVFFKTSSGILNDKSVRQALVRAANVSEIISKLGYSTHAVGEPLLDGQLGYNSHYLQAGFNEKSASALLTADGWISGKDGILVKNNHPLSFTISATNTSEYRMVTAVLKQQWRKIGVNLNIQLQSPSDFSNTLNNHDYDALLYGISIGPDPDVFVYWDSSQADIRSANRLNFSEYNNPVADQSLESGRTRLDSSLRTIKYKPFLAAWQQDAPALGLFQPRLLYLTNGPVAGLDNHIINTNVDRFENVQNWEIRSAYVTDKKLYPIQKFK